MWNHEETPLLIGTDCPSTDEQKHGIYNNILYSRWQSFTGILFYVSVVGTTYAFGVYSELLKEDLDFSQDDIDIIASVGNTGLYLSLIAGFILEEFGLQILVRFGAFLIFLGFMYIFLAIKGWVPANLVSICILFFLGQFGVCCHVSSAVSTSVRLFPSEAIGAAVGLAKGYYGISSAVLGDFAGGYFAEAKVYFILFMATAIPCISLYGSYVANFLPSHMIPFEFDRAKGVSTSMMPFFLHWGSLFTVIFAVGYAEFAFTLSDYVMIPLSTVLAVLILCINFLPDYYGNRVVVDTGPPPVEVSDDEKLQLEGGEEEDEKRLAAYQSGGGAFSDSVTNTGRFTQENTIANCSSLEMADESASKKQQKTQSQDSILEADHIEEPECFYGQSLPLLESLQTWRFWLLYALFVCLAGAGLTVIDNVDAIAQALGETPSSFFVTLVSLANGLGRVTAGYASDNLLHYCSKLQLLSTVGFLMSIAQLLFAIGSSVLLYPCLLLVGYLFGCMVSLVVVNVADVFGSRHIATNFGAIDSAPIFGSYIFVTGIVAVFYRTNVADDLGGSSCLGASCFRNSFLVNGVCCFIVATLTYVMHIYTPIKFKVSPVSGAH